MTIPKSWSVGDRVRIIGQHYVYSGHVGVVVEVMRAGYRVHASLAGADHAADGSGLYLGIYPADELEYAPPLADAVPDDGFPEDKGAINASDTFNIAMFKDADGELHITVDGVAWGPKESSR